MNMEEYINKQSFLQEIRNNRPFSSDLKEQWDWKYFEAMTQDFPSKSENEIEETFVEPIIETYYDKEWFDDLRLYHYVGFLVDRATKVSSIYKEWSNCGTKAEFLKDYIIPSITEKIKDCKDLDRQYEIDEGQGKRVVWKTQCRPLLLLHNLQTVINQTSYPKLNASSESYCKSIL